MDILENYLQSLTEKSKWKEKVSDLSDDSINKLKNSGIVKPEKKYTKGIKKGTSNILKKQKAEVMYNKAFGVSGPVTISNTVMHDKGNSKIFRLLLRLKKLNLSPREWARIKPLIDRHEADEVVAFAKQLKDGVAPSVTNYFNKKGSLVGAHASPDVLRKEKNIMDFQRKIYPHKALDKFNKFRTNTGEYALASKKKKELDIIKKKLLELRKEREILINKTMEVGEKFAKEKGIINKLNIVRKNIKMLVKAGNVMKGIKYVI